MNWKTRFGAAVALLVAGVWMAQAQPTTAEVSKTANPELVGELAKELGATPQQAEGAAGALLSSARQRMPAADWTTVSAAIPGIDGLLKAAPSMAVGTGGSGAAAAASAMGTAGAAAGGAAAAFTKLGLKPEMVAKAIPILTQYVSKTGGANVASLLSSALK